MKIPKLFKKAAALVMAAVTVLSVLPATTAFAAGDIGTISFTHTYDSNGNAMRYNFSANIGGYTAGGTGNYKYRMYVDGETAFCIQPGVPLKTGNTLAKASSETWNALSANQKKAVGLALLYGYQGNRSNLTGSDDEKWLATQTLVWEFVTGCREATGSYKQTSTTVYSLHFGSNYANSGARAAYDQIVSLLGEHNTIPSGTPKYAALRSTVGSSFKGDASGSDKRYSFRLLAREPTDKVHLFEAAIDLLSYATYLKCEGKDYRAVNLLSLSGVYQPKKELSESKIPIALSTYLRENPQIKTVILHLDNDKTGRLCTAALKELLQKDYKIVDAPPPVGKDVNDFLMSYLGLARQNPARERPANKSQVEISDF